ncbi:MAG: immunoglobulin-like domain-containing protein, partial [Culicoidibacterales bacterium]
DSAGASATKTRLVTVNAKLVGMNKIPTISADDVTLTVGDAFDPLTGVSAMDAEDGDLTQLIEVISSNVDMSQAGVYTVTYKVTDKAGASATKTRLVTVKAQPIMNETFEDLLLDSSVVSNVSGLGTQVDPVVIELQPQLTVEAAQQYLAELMPYLVETTKQVGTDGFVYYYLEFEAQTMWRFLSPRANNVFATMKVATTQVEVLNAFDQALGFVEQPEQPEQPEEQPQPDGEQVIPPTEGEPTLPESETQTPPTTVEPTTPEASLPNLGMQLSQLLLVAGSAVAATAGMILFRRKK